MYLSYDDFIQRINVDSLPDEYLSDTDGYNVVMACLQDASAIVKSYITISYEDFLEAPDYSVLRCVANIAFFYLMNKRGFNSGNQSDVVIANEYKWSIEYLEKVQNSQVILTNYNESTNNLKNKPFVV